MSNPTGEILSPAHVKAIGELVVNVSKLDSLLTDLTAVFMHTNLISAIIAVHHQQFSNKVSTLTTLVRLALSEEEGRALLLDLLGQAKGVADFRNTMVHAHWTTDETGTAYAVRFEARGEFKRQKSPYSSEQIQERADEGAALARKIAALRDHLVEGLKRDLRRDE